MSLVIASAQAADPWTIAVALGTVAAGVAAAAALLFNLLTLRAMRDDRRLGVAPYLVFDHDSFRGRAAREWASLQQEGVPEGEIALRVLTAVCEQPYEIRARNVGNGPAVNCYYFAYCGYRLPGGELAEHFFATEWFSLGAGSDALPDGHPATRAYGMRRGGWEEAQARTALGGFLPEPPSVQGIEAWDAERARRFFEEAAVEGFCADSLLGRRYRRIRGISRLLDLAATGA